MVFKFILATIYTCLTVVSFNASAVVLQERLGGLAYYDADADLTWLADATSGATRENGGTIRTWASAKTWVAGLDVAGVTGWRLPTTMQPDPSCSPQESTGNYAYNCTGSELGNLFYTVLGGVATESITVTHNANYNLFSNVQSYRYWSSTEYALDPADAWYFYTNLGRQNYGTKGGLNNIWAVKSGDVAVVPVPAAIWLFGSGLIGVVGAARRRKSVTVKG